MLRARLIGAVLGAAGVLLLAFTGSGQEKLGLAGGGDSLRGALLRTPETQKELKLTKEQIAKITRIAEEAKTSKKKVEEAHGKVKGRGKEKAKGDDPVAKEQERLVREAMGGDLAELERETDQQINAVLDSRQRTRLTQIVLRVQGPSAFLTPELIDALALGPEQLELIQEILTGVKAEQEQYKESQKQAGELVKASGAFDLEKVRKSQQKTQARSFAYKLNKEVMPQIGKVLTRRQREIYNRMLGDSFDLAKLTGPEGQPLIDDSAGLAGLLLREPAVQLELKLTDPQKDQLSRGGRPDKVLDARQRSRLQQIVFQAEGLSALSRPEVVRALQLDDEQLEQIQGALSNLVGESKQLRDALKAAAPDFEPGDPGQEAARKEQEKARLRSGSNDLNARVFGQIRAILSRRQRDIFARMQGEPFDFSKLRARPPVR
jgi:Spy/CpxP family protein refolding chaperone